MTKPIEGGSSWIKDRLPEKWNERKWAPRRVLELAIYNNPGIRRDQIREMCKQLNVPSGQWAVQWGLQFLLHEGKIKRTDDAMFFMADAVVPSVRVLTDDEINRAVTGRQSPSVASTADRPAPVMTPMTSEYTQSQQIWDFIAGLTANPSDILLLVTAFHDPASGILNKAILESMYWKPMVLDSTAIKGSVAQLREGGLIAKGDSEGLLVTKEGAAIAREYPGVKAEWKELTQRNISAEVVDEASA